MPMQLKLDLTVTPALQGKPLIKNATWLDVSDLARGVGFTGTAHISVTLHDELEPLQTETDGDYDQRLYDVIWLAHHYWRLDQRPAFSFTFDFLREDQTTGLATESSLRLHVEVNERTAQLGLLQDF
jgi:hypothetical protein